MDLTIEVDNVPGALARVAAAGEKKELAAA